MIAYLALAALLAIATPVEAKQTRSTAAKNAFKRQVPCPATGQPQGACPGWIIDHIIPLCAGGQDAPSNMQWQTVAEAQAKDRIEWATCRELRKTHPPQQEDNT